MNNRPARAEWFHNTWFVLLLCLLIVPIGIYVLWTNAAAKKQDPEAQHPSARLARADITPLIKKPVFNTPYDFKTAFNKAVPHTKLGYEIAELLITEGNLQNTFHATLNSHLALAGTMHKETGKVLDVMMIGTGDGSIQSATDIFLCMATLIHAVDPKMPAKESSMILKELGMLGNTESIMHLNKQTDRNGIRYFLTSSEITGFTFGVSHN
jgi:hypothetical protein